ncbi:MAG: hypothetical protein RIB60_06605 [Phycisphaerales bacterium]
MSASGKAFDEVKRILGRLDRSIDEARTKRLGPDEPPAPRRSEPARDDQTIGGPPVAPKAPLPAPQRRPSKYGRAKPLRRGEDAPKPDATSTWVDPSRADRRPAKPDGFDDDTLIG